MKEYRFSLGNSNTDGFGICFDVPGETREEAVAYANEVLKQVVQGFEVKMGDIEIVIYAGPALRVTAADIEDEGEDD